MSITIITMTRKPLNSRLKNAINYKKLQQKMRDRLCKSRA